MPLNPHSNNKENGRLKALRTYEALDAASLDALDSITQLASGICSTPMAFISLVDHEKVNIQASKGITLKQLPKSISFCRQVVEDECVLEVTDAREHSLYASNPVVTASGICFYAGAPLVNPEGHVLGTLCVMDREAKQLSVEQRQSLEALAKLAINQFELKRSKQEVENTRNLYHRIIQEAGDIIYTTGRDGNFTYINAAVEKITGYTERQLIGKKFYDIISPRWKDKARLFYARQFRQGTKESHLEFQVITAQGGLKWVEQTVVMLSRNGEHIGFEGVVRDIERRKRIEEELLKAKELAEQSARVKEQFLANMSHEIRTPMNAVLGFTELLAATALSGEQREFLSAINSSGKNLMTVINDILDYSKIEAGMMPFEKVPLNIRSLLASLSVMFGERARQKGLALSVEVSELVPQVILGDPSRLSQIVTNLMGNALKFTAQGFVKVRAGVESRRGNAIGIRLSVADSGIGIHSSKLETVFERFNQASNDTSRKYGGTGLGLSITKKLVDLQGGTLSLKSEPGKGSEFSVVIPYEVQSEEQAAIEMEAGRAVQPLIMEGLNILLAEDNQLNQQLAVKLLGKAGHTVDLADNGRIAIEKLEKGNYDVVLMDIQMPEMNGYEATVHIRRVLKSNIPVIAMTAHAMSAEIEKCHAIGMNGYISKPFKVNDLYEKLQSIVKRMATEAENVENTNSRLFDPSCLEKLGEGDLEFMRSILDIFMEQMPAELELMDRAITDNDVPALQQVAHKLRSSVGTIGLDPLMVEQLAEIEGLAKEEQVPEAIARLAREFGRSCRLAMLEIGAWMRYSEKCLASA